MKSGAGTWTSASGTSVLEGSTFPMHSPDYPPL